MKLSSVKQKVSQQSTTSKALSSAGPDGIGFAPPNTGLPDELKAGVEDLSDLSLDEVRVRYNKSTGKQSRAIAAIENRAIGPFYSGIQTSIDNSPRQILQAKFVSQVQSLARNPVECMRDVHLSGKRELQDFPSDSFNVSRVVQGKWSLNRDLAELQGVVIYFEADKMLTYDPETRKLVSLYGDMSKALNKTEHEVLMRMIQMDVGKEEDDELRRLGFSVEDIAEVNRQGEASASSDVESEDEDEAPILLYHGTDEITANRLAAGEAIKARGKGELGGGFYMCHDMYQAAHIADYYCSTETRAGRWAVVEFTISQRKLQSLISNQRILRPGEFETYYQQVKASGNAVESEYAWTIGPIIDRHTPYIQHLFAQEGIVLLNDKSTTRRVVLSGTVGTEKSKYMKEGSTENYNPNKDPILKELLDMEEPDESEEDEDNDTQYQELAQQVQEAITKKAPKLTKAVMKRLSEAFETTHEERYEALMKELEGSI